MGFLKLMTSLFRNTKEELFLDSSDPLQIKDKLEDVFRSIPIERFQDYQLIKKIGKGSMGVVYMALHKPSKQKLAIKIISSKKIPTQKSIERFRQEIDVHRKLRHANIVRFYGIGPHPKGVFVAMEYVEGQNLEQYVAIRQKLDIYEALSLTSQILLALCYANSYHIIHRDLKPANIFIERTGKNIKIGDFGLAKFTNDRYRDVSSTGEILGTPAYMAPEQLHCSKNVDIHADIYSIGCILYYMLTGRRPYSQIKNMRMLVQRKMRTNLDNINSLPDSIPDQTKKILAKSMAPKIRQRYATPRIFYRFVMKNLKSLEKEQQRMEREKRRTKNKRISLVSGKTKFISSTDPMTETFMSSGSLSVVDDVVVTFQQELKTFCQSPAQTILSSFSKSHTEMNEETMLAVTMVSSKLPTLSELEKKVLKNLRKNDLLRAVTITLKKDRLKQEERIWMTDLKNSLLLRGRTLVQPDMILDFINEGTRFLKKQLVAYSKVSLSSPINARAKYYFLYLIENQLKEHEQLFRSKVEKCTNSYQLESLLELYPLHSKTTIKSYQNLRIIQKIITIKKRWDKNPEKLHAILSKYLGSMGEQRIRMAFTKLQLGDRTSTILKLIIRERSIESLLHSLKNFQGNQQVKKTASDLHLLLSAFLNPSNKTSLEELKIALNFIPIALRNKINLLARQYLLGELNQKTQAILSSREPVPQRLKSFLELLAIPRYSYPTITCFGYPTEELRQKIELVRYQGKPLRQVFPKKIPTPIKNLIQQDQTLEKSLRQKNQENCIAKLQQLKIQTRGRRPPRLFEILVKIFQVHGQVNFSTTSSNPLTGYQVAQQIIAFYRNPARYDIELPCILQPEIYNLVKEMIHEERQRDKRKRKN